MSSLTLTAIQIFPVKSTAASNCTRIEVEPRGLRHDRRWAVVDSSGVALTAREHPILTRVRSWTDDTSLRLRAPGDDSVLTLGSVTDAAPDHRAWVWGDPVEVRDCGDEAASWFEAVLDRAVRLVEMTDRSSRAVDPDLARPGDEVSFADGFPVMLIGASSLRDVDERVPGKGDPRRFRPNLVVSGAPPYAEDGWRRIRIGAVEFEGVRNCERCEVPTIDPDTGEKDRDREPMRTLAGYRRRPGGVFLGQNLIPRGSGCLAIGDPVVVLE